jgi:hypothetical protein
MVRRLLSERGVHWLGMALALVAQQEAETLDLLDELDEVDPATRAEIEEAIDRGDDLSELPFFLSDLAYAPRTRDGAIALFATFAHVRSEEAAATSFFVGLGIDFDELLLAPEAYGAPPDEHRRFELCRSIARAPPVDRIDVRAEEERSRALGCGWWR